jgi:hypothetical protein
MFQSIVSVIFTMLTAGNALAHSQLVSGQKMLDPETEQLWKVTFSGTFDARFVYTGTERNWNKPGPAGIGGIGGRGLTRYGGVDRDGNGRGDSRSSAFKLPQATLVTDVTYSNNFIASLQLNFDDGNEGDGAALGLAEAYVGYSQPVSRFHGFTTRLGMLIPPVSLEHPNTGWSTEYTITPSALNTWIGEEIRTTGLELTWRRKSGVDEWSFTAAPFSGNDTAGTLLAFRGWAMHDLQLRKGLRLRVQEHTAAPASRTTDPFTEIDGRLGAYGQIAYRYRDSLDVRVFAYDNNGNEESWIPSGDRAWDTNAYVASIMVKPASWMTIVTQGLSGRTALRFNNSFMRNRFYSYFGLVSFTAGKARFSLRYDQFQVSDLAWPADQSSQFGRAATAAFLYRFNSAHMAGLEWLHMHSRRSGNEGYPVSDPNDDLLQLAYRFTF